MVRIVTRCAAIRKGPASTCRNRSLIFRAGTRPEKSADQIMRPTINRILPHLLITLVLAPFIAWAQPDAAEDTAFADLIVRLSNTLDFSERTLLQTGIGKRELQPLLENVTVVKESALLARKQADLGP